MMRLVLILTLLSAGAACKRSANEEISAPEAKSYAVTKEGRLVLTVTDAPGPIVSTAVRPADGSRVKHPFLSASAHDSGEEDALGKILEKSTSTADFLARLNAAGYVVAPR